MAFNARLDIAYSYIDSPPLEATIKAAFVDYLGLYVGDNIAPGFRIIQDVTGAGFPYDTLVYEILENQGILSISMITSMAITNAANVEMATITHRMG